MTLPEELLKRVEAATGSDRELDALITTWRHPELAEWPRRANGGWESPEWGHIAPPEHFTSSLDAALRLCERVLPGWIVETLGEHAYADHRAKGPWRCNLRSNPVLSGVTYGQCHYAKTAALALLAALLKAVQAKGDDRG